MSPKNPAVEPCFSESHPWQKEFKKLRTLLLSFPLAEELKWGKPCYTFQGSNIIILQGFKDCCALMFCKGALLRDARGILVKPGENTQAARQARFTDVRQITELAPALKEYVAEAIAAEKAGLKVDFKESRDLVFTPELQARLHQNPRLKAAFEKLTPGRQRAYHLYFCQPKQSKTRESRIDKCAPRILQGLGLHDR